MMGPSTGAPRNREDTQARILCVTSGLAGMLYSSVELARRLAAAGHRLIYASYPHSRDLVELHGFEFLPLEPSRYDEFLEADRNSGALNRLFNLGDRRQRAIESLAVDGFADRVSATQPDLVLIDGEMHEHIIAALLNTFASIWRQPGLPPAHCMVRPGVGWKGTRTGTALLWIGLRLKKKFKASRLRARRIGCDRLSILRQLAHDVGFDLGSETDDRQWLTPFTYRRLPVLSLHALEFEFPHRPPELVQYVGPMVLESRNDRKMTPDEQFELEAVFERRRHAGGERKIIFAGFGSELSTRLSLIERLLGVVRDRPNWDLVISLSGRMKPADLGPLPERVYAFSWVPQMTVMRHADAVVTHGGINTIDECVVNGLPMLVYCGNETDMAGNTARIAYHGIGIAGDLRRDSTADIRRHIDRLFSEPGFAVNLKRLQRSYLAYAENRVAERVVESLLGQQLPDRSSFSPGADS
jgi:zeaxanthin glucosyltransferase